MGNDIINGILVNLATTVALTALSVLSVYAVLYMNKLKSKAILELQKIEDDKTRDYANDVLNRVTDALSTSIDKIESTLVKSLKEASVDGKLTEEDRKFVASEARKLAEQLIKQDLTTLLDGIVGDTDKYIDAKIASLVIAKKHSIQLSTSDTSTEIVLNE